MNLEQCSLEIEKRMRTTALPIFHEHDDEFEARRDWNPFLHSSLFRKLLCQHYWIEIGREFRGLVDGTYCIWACAHCNKQIAKPLGDVPFNPLHYHKQRS